MQSNRLLERIRSDDPSLGAWISTMSPRSAEVLATTTLDWAVIDMEHTPIGESGVESILRAFDPEMLTPLVRIPSIDYGLQGICKRVLDSGAHGIIIPRVETVEQAKAIVEAAYFPPLGERGVGGRIRANRHGMDFDRYIENASTEILVIAQIETKRAAENAEAILDIEGIDAAFIGENDLSTTHGGPGQKDLPAVQADVDRILATARAAGVFTGIVAPSVDRIQRRIDEGFDFISIGSDLSLINRATDTITDQVD